MRGTDYHRVATMIDPTTGLPRLIFGNDQGVWSVLDNNGTFEIADRDLRSTARHQPQRQPPDHPVLLRCGPAQQRRRPDRRRPVLRQRPGQRRTGLGPQRHQQRQHHLERPRRRRHRRGHRPAGPGHRPTSTSGPAAAATTPTSSSSSAPASAAPACRLTSAGPSACSRQSGGFPTPDPQWPLTGGANFAVDPVNSSDVVISSSVGRIFSTSDQGVTWFDIGDPAVFGSPGSFSVALAYGAPDPNAPDGHRQPGQLHLRRHRRPARSTSPRTAAAAAPSNNWINISLGLERLGRPVDHHRPHPRQPRRLRRHHRRRVLPQGLGPPGEQPHQHPVPVGQHHRQHPQPAVHHLRPDLRPDDRPELDQAATRPDRRCPRSWPTGGTRSPTVPTDPNGPGFHPVLYVGTGNSGATARACTSRSTTA